jgi:hypothetical protein
MAKAIYHYLDGRNQLVAVPCEADKDGNLTKEGDKAPFCTEAKSAKTPTSGCYVLESEAKAAKAAKATKAGKTPGAGDPPPDGGGDPPGGEDDGELPPS